MRFALRLTTAVLLAALAAGCGDDEPPATETPSPTVTTPAASPTPPPPPPPATETASPTPTAAGETYEVQPGDSLSAIAQRFNTTVEALVEANGITDPDQLFPGDQLTIPPGG